MSTFGPTEKELVFDYCFGRLSPSEAQRVEALIERDGRAAAVCDKIRDAVAPLGCIVSDCPEELVNSTVRRLCVLAARTGAVEPSRSRALRLGLRPNLSQVAAVLAMAASILLVLGTALPAFNFVRQRHYRQVCLSQLDRIFKSIELYSADYDDTLPAVARAQGASWDGIGVQDPGGYSNTRNLYLLLKLGYNRTPAEFICCGGSGTRAAALKPSQISAYQDFPSRDAVTYSYRLMSNPKTKKSSLASKPLMADMNPHFQTVPLNMDVCPAGDTLHLNSINHNRRGQSILYGDGHALFSPSRVVDGADDIYTIENTPTYRGYEWPAGPNDTFVAP